MKELFARYGAPLGVAALALGVLAGCSAPVDDTPAPTATASPSQSTGAAFDAPDVEKVDVDDDLEDTFGDRIDELPRVASETAALLDGFAQIQKPDTDIDALEVGFKNHLGEAVDPDTKDELWDDIVSESGSDAVPMWTGDATLTVDGTDYIVTGEPWVAKYGEPLVEHVKADTDTGIDTVKYSYQVRYHIPVKDADGNDLWAAYEQNKALDFQPGYEGQEWVLAGLWASAPTTPVMVDGGDA